MAVFLKKNYYYKNSFLHCKQIHEWDLFPRKLITEDVNSKNFIFLCYIHAFDILIFIYFLMNIKGC